MPALLILILLSLIWLGLSQTAFFVGPSEWDDNAYCSVAAVPRAMPSIASRYFHIWSLRVFNLLMDTRRSAAAVYPALLTVGLCWAGFFLGRRVGGVACGILAAVIMPFYPALLQYITVPYADTPMAFWAAVAIIAALVAVDAKTVRRRTFAVVVSGVFVVLSTQCKETGIATLPPVLVALWACDRKWKVAAALAVGALSGWIILCAMDWAFMGEFWWRWHWTTYFPQKSGGGGGASAYRMNQHYLEMLLTTDFLPFTLLGVAGAAVAFRESLAARCVAIWAFSVLAFSSLISCKFQGVQALDRYCVGMGVPLVILGAYWVVRMWRQPVDADAGAHSKRPIGFVVAVLLMLGLGAYGLSTELAGTADKGTVRFAFYLIPPAYLLLFLAPWLTHGRWASRVSNALIVVIAATMSTQRAVEYFDYKRSQLEPWVELTEALDATGADLARWNLPEKPFTRFRIERRCRTLSKRPPQDLTVRDVSSLKEVESDEWLFSSREAAKDLARRGWKPFVAGGQEGVVFVVYRKTTSPRES